MIPSGNQRSAPLQHPIAPSGSHAIHTGSWLFCRADEIADALLQPTAAAREQAARKPCFFQRTARRFSGLVCLASDTRRA